MSWKFRLKFFQHKKCLILTFFNITLVPQTKKQVILLSQKFMILFLVPSDLKEPMKKQMWINLPLKTVPRKVTVPSCLLDKNKEELYICEVFQTCTSTVGTNELMAESHRQRREGV